ncbi:NCS1 allantoate transporter [Macrophomina phaseolina]|uniref:NCS1 allantoate transporter n=1 Tax=Macrophomina phaseolina TaxID=35725 RepID=A0ABQ8FRN8_9PEZI|nr:NCS1 allantoate transporter [Macrophomina phaseolina]
MVIQTSADSTKQWARRKAAIAKRRLNSRDAWVLEKQTSTFAPPGTWTNIDNDVTPVERRTWGGWSIIGYWMSDILSSQSWAGASAIISIGLTYREALVCLIIGTTIIAIPLCLNGSVGAKLHVPYAIAARSSFGYLFSRVPVVIRMVTALFWHAIQTYSGATAMTQVIRAVWPSYLDIPNRLPSSAGITTQQMVSHLVFWLVQFPVLLIPPHKLKGFFLFKAVYVTLAAVATVIGMCVKAGGSGDIWDQKAQFSGSERSWLILYFMSSLTGSWATMATNVADYTRYLRRSDHVWLQALLMPGISTFIGVMGIIATSASKVVYGEYIWDPIQLASRWDGPGGRAAAFFVGIAWCVAQIGVNVSANVISCANDMTSLCPKYINIRRGAVITTIIGGWVMVPWKIVSSASSLINFMSALAVFLAPIAALLAADFWVVKRQAIDVPALYRPHDRYHYWKGTNWRAIVAMVVSLGPNMPGLIHNVNDSIDIGGASKIYNFNYLWGFTSAFVLYCGLSFAIPARETLISKTVNDSVEMSSESRGEKGEIRETVERTVV